MGVMNTIQGTILITAIIQLLFLSPGPCLAQSREFDEIMSDEGAAGVREDEGGFGFHFQLGYMHRVASSLSPGTKQNYLITGDLSGLNWSRKKATLGLGVHFAFDDSGHRIGVKGLWRTPLKKGTGSYFQLAPGVYVSGTDDLFDPRMPSFFLEAELGAVKELAFVAGVEVLRYENRHLGYTQVDSWTWEPRVEANGTATSFFLGAKAGQLGAMIIAASGLIAGIAVAASMSQSGFM
jgi:hypothetical protein